MFVAVTKPFSFFFVIVGLVFFFILNTEPFLINGSVFQIFKSNKTSILLLNYIDRTEHLLISVADLTCALSNERFL